MSQTARFLISSLLLAVALGLGVWVYPILTTPNPGEEITAQVFLKNDCGITDDAFMLFVPSTGKRIAFANKEVKLTIKSGEPLQLVASSTYPKIRYDGATEPAARRTTLNVQCNPSDFENSINRPLRNQFGG